MKRFFEYKELVYELAIRDIKLRYRKPFLGFLWMLIMPFSTALIYKILFSDFMHVTSSEYPFFIHLITALLPWAYFSSSIQSSARAILDNRGIINQISFPKYLLPVSVVFANLINFLPALLVLLGFLFAFQVRISSWIIFLPVVILIHTALIVGFSLVVSALQVLYRDVEYIIQVLLMFLFFLTPGVYTLEEVINKDNRFFTKIYMLNPLVGLLNQYRAVFIKGYLKTLHSEVNFLNIFAIPLLCSIGVLFFGFFTFKRYEKRFSDYLNV